MSTAKRLALIALGYAIALGAGLAAVAVNEWLMPEEISQTSGGMVAFGDMILFVLVTGFFSLAPTWFLLRLAAGSVPRALLAVELAMAALGPASWLAVVGFASSPGGSSLPNMPQAIAALIGLLIAFVAIPRMVFGPVLLLIEAATFFMMRGRAARMLIAAAMLMDLIPLVLFALHMVRATRY